MRRALAIALAVLVAPALALAQPSVTLPQQGQVRIKAQRVRYDAKARIFTASGSVVLVFADLTVYADAMRVELGPMLASAGGHVRLRQKSLALTADTLNVELRPQIVRASGGVAVTDEGLSLKAATLTYGLRSTDLDARGGVVLSQAGTTVTGEVVVANLKEKRGEARGGARVVRKPGPVPGRQSDAGRLLASEETIVTASEMRLSWATGYEASASGGVRVLQRDKNAAADAMTYSEKDGRLVLEGSVRLEQLSGEWLFKTNLITSPPKDPETRKALEEQTVVTARRLVIVLAERDMEIEGNVKVVQQGRTAQGDRATYTEKDKKIVLTGNVLLTQADGSKLRSDKVIISLVDQTFEAVGNVETVFTLKGK